MSFLSHWVWYVGCFAEPVPHPTSEGTNFSADPFQNCREMQGARPSGKKKTQEQRETTERMPCNYWWSILVTCDFYILSNVYLYICTWIICSNLDISLTKQHVCILLELGYMFLVNTEMSGRKSVRLGVCSNLAMVAFLPCPKVFYWGTRHLVNPMHPRKKTNGWNPKLAKGVKIESSSC